MSLWDKAVESLKDKHKQNVNFERTDKHAILADILVEVQKKKQACIERRLKYKRKNGEVVVLYDVYEKMVKWVTKFKEVGDIAVQYDPGHAALPWAAIRFFLQISVNDVQIFGILAEGLEMVSKIVARYTAIERLYLGQPASVDNLLESSITALYASILVFFSKCRSYFDLGVAQRLVRSITLVPEQLAGKYLEIIAVKERNVKELTRIVDAERAQLSVARQSCMTDKIDNLGNAIETLQIGSQDSTSKLEALLDSFQSPLVRTVQRISTLAENMAHSRDESQMKEERLQILRWLSNIQYKKHHQSLSKGLLEGTGSWLLRKPQFLEWRNSSVSSVLWLHGIPGSGKTCLMSTVIRQLLAENSACENAAPIAYFYCQRNSAEPQRSDPIEVLRAILRQLLCYNPLWQETSSIAKEYRARKLEADEDGFEISRLDLLETTDHMIKIASQIPVTILIDALDECRSDQRHGLLGALDVLLERSTHLVKVFVSSRDDVDIVLRLQKHPNVYVNVDDNKDDVHRFIESEIQKAQNNRKLLKGTISPEITILIAETLATKAGGMFLWVKLQIDNLCDSRRIKIESDLVDELARLPKSLAEMYALIIQNIGQIEQRGRIVAETIFKWLICTKDASARITIAACSGAISIEHQQLSVSDILDVCSTLVVYDEALDRFRFAHLSIREFLESQQGYTPSEAHRCVVERSLQTLVLDQPLVDPFRSYATFYWILHYHRLEEQHRKEVFELHAKRFLFNGVDPSEFFRTWSIEAQELKNGWHVRKYLQTEHLGIHHENWSHFTECFQNPVDLASCFGWLEILDHFEAGQRPDEFSCWAMRIMTIAIRYCKASVVRWLVVRKFYTTFEQLELALDVARYIPQPEMVQTVIESYLHSSDTVVDGQKLLAATVRSELVDICQDLVSMDCQEQHEHTFLSHTSIRGSKIIHNLLLTGTNPIVQGHARRAPLSLWLRSEQQLKFYYEHSNQSVGRILEAYYYYTACLLVHYELDSVLKDKDLRTEWTEILRVIATLSIHQRDAAASLTERARRLETDSEDQMQWVDQTLLSMASLFRHEKAFQILLDRGVDPTCPALCESRKRMMSSVGLRGHSITAQALLVQKHKSDYNNISDELRQGPLALAAYTGNLPLLQSILDRGLDPNIKNRKGQTALYFAAQRAEEKDIGLEVDKEAIVQLLLRRGALVTSADAYSGATVIANAFKARFSKVAKILWENGAAMPMGPINRPTEQLLVAFRSGHEGIRQTLLERTQGGEVDLPKVQWSSSGRRCFGDPLDVAAKLILGGTIRVLGDVLNSSIDR